MADTLLSGDAFNNDQSQRLFEVIDELHGCGAKAYIDLPEIVIVGDQSSGKSSLLQSLTDIPFPVAGRLCTRFPTRIVSRRTPGGPDVTKISIEATIFGLFEKAPSASFEREQKYADFERSGNDLSEKDFTRAVDDAMRLMGISVDPSNTDDTNEAGKKPNFSSDVLRIELSGPSRSHFSILDVPGVFQSRTKDVTAHEMEGVKKLVSAEMRRKQSIVVCVANGTSDLATQAIFEMASKEDPLGERTLGVITKCDVTQHPDLVVRLARNDRDADIYFHRGWFVVRNRTPSEAADRIDSTERQLREEKLFDAVPWNSLPSSRRGVQALKKHLANLLLAKMQEAFPKMLADIQDRIKSTSTTLASLGSDRSSIEQKRTYLTRIAHRFNTIALDVLRGRYDMIEGDELKLRKYVRDANDGFMRQLKLSGFRVPFVAIPKLQYLEGHSGIGTQGTSQPTGSSLFSTPQTNEQAAGGSGLIFRKSEPIKVGSEIPGTRDAIFQPRIEQNPGLGGFTTPFMDHYQSISFMPWFARFSFEELRLKDYVQGQSTSNNNGSVFGAPWNPAPAPATNQSAVTVDANGSPATGFSQYASNNKASSAFAQALKDSNPSTGAFGGFGLGNTGFGSTGTGSIFDNKPTTSTFGSSPSEKPASGLFASAPDSKPTTGLFGSAPTDKPTGGPFGATPESKSVFGQFASNPPSNKSASDLFGIPPNNRSTTNAFGASPSDKPAAGLFGSTPDAKPIPSLFGPTPGQKPTSPPMKPANGTTPGSDSGDTDPQNAEIYRWIRTEIKSNRGVELQGTLNPDVLPMLFHQQACKWGDIAEKHFATVVKFSLSVLNGILESVECDRITRRMIRPLIHDASEAGEKDSINSLVERFNNIRSRHLQTSNTTFEEKVAQARYQRFQAALDRYRILQKQKNFFAPNNTDPNLQFVVDMRDTAQLFSELHMSNSRNLENEIHDTLKAYYEIARDDYIEYVTQHIVENFISSEQGPVLKFSPLYVAGLSDEQIEGLAVEDEGVVKDRIEKEETLKRLKSAERIALRYA